MEDSKEYHIHERTSRYEKETLKFLEVKVMISERQILNR